jgi:hypothetical protein
MKDMTPLFTLAGVRMCTAMRNLLERLENQVKSLDWYHGGPIDGPLGTMHLSPSEALASMYGTVHVFRIKPSAKWLDLADGQMLKSVSMDSLGYNENAIKRVQERGYDIVWDSHDFHRGYEQIFVSNPDALDAIGK